MSIKNDHFRFFIEGDVSGTEDTPTITLRRYKERQGVNAGELTNKLVTQVDNNENNDVDIASGFFLFSVDRPTQTEVFSLTPITKQTDADGEIYYTATTEYRGVNPTITTTPTSASSFSRNYREHYNGDEVFYIEAFSGGGTGGTSDNLGNHTATQALSMAGFGINTLLDPVNAQDAATKSYVDGLAGLNPFLLSIAPRDLAEPRVLSWQAVIGASSYDVYRDGVLLTNTTNLTYTDSAVLSATVNYDVRAQMGNQNAQIGTQFVYANINSNDLSVYRGDGSDGSFTGGTLTANQTYNFTDINLTSDMVVDGNLVLVQSNVNFNGFNVISTLSNGTSSQSVDVDATTYTLAQTAITPSTGGTNGSSGVGGNAAADRATAGGDGGDATTTGQPASTGGTGGILPSGPAFNGNPGSAPTVAGSTTGHTQGAGGGAGSHALGHTPIMMLVGGNYDDTGSVFIGQGADGGDGGNGQSLSAVLGLPKFGGNGGAGGDGGDGLIVYVKVDGVPVSAPTLLLNGGNKGIAGIGGTCTGGTSNVDGNAGNDGADGVNGSLNFI